VQFDPDEWGTVAEWISGLGTIGALLLTFFLLRHELQQAREDRKQAAEREAERQTDQAGRVAAWARQDTFPNRPPEITVLVRNASASPVYNVLVEVSESLGDAQASHFWHPVPPGETVSERLIPAEWAHIANLGEVNTQLRFTDSQGRHWLRNWYGELERQDQAPRSC
jgi:hypothetical protein